ncbi:hypothetical protein MOQ_004341 [Trypanosoma cruzi marinkellei]|uniref:Uncharacterized protein n=1 Tax=Trypanosoma cruzi marinkellei TaxID=85056 RepID=K2N1G1_TRYCR|nr:hypothetical protein MOQ_004341 [Trypanosoma cruzi marinkellei]
MDPPHCSFANGGGFAEDFDPVICLRLYRRRDIAALAIDINGAFDLRGVVVPLRPVTDTYLEKLNTSQELARCLLEHEEPRLVRNLQPTDFISPSLGVENVVVATSLGLWKTTRYTNEVIEAARTRFLRGVEEKRRSKKSKLPIRLFFKFLNEMQIDVVVMSTDRKSVIVSCASTTRRLAMVAFPDEQNTSVPSFRTLLALEFSPSEGYWRPLLLPVQLRTPTLKLDIPEIRDVAGSCSKSDFLKPQTLTSTFGETAQSCNLETMMLDRTFYNPQRISAKTSRDLQTLEEKGDGASASTRSPFTGMRYPNISQMDLQLIEVLRRGLHPALRRNRVRFFVTFFVAMAAFIVGLVLVIYASVTLETCCHHVSSRTCLNGAEDLSSDSRSNLFCNAAKNPALTEAKQTFFFGHLKSPGRFLVAAICCMFVSSLLAGAVSYFTTRAIAQKNSRPFFYKLMMAFHVILGAVACAFSAYTLSIFSHTVHEVPCLLFSGTVSASCSRFQALYPEFVIDVRARHPVHVVFALSVIFIIFCTVEFFASWMSPMVDDDTLHALQKAEPETNVFYPSVYAPDGISDAEKRKLRGHIGHLLHMQLQKQMQQQDTLLTRNLTIGEMILAKREKSLMVGPSQGSFAMNSRHWNEDMPQNPLPYTADSDNTSSGSSTDNEEEKKEPDEREEKREVPPRLLAEVEQISRRVKTSMDGRTDLVKPQLPSESPK